VPSLELEWATAYPPTPSVIAATPAAIDPANLRLVENLCLIFMAGHPFATRCWSEHAVKS
jgi:hypothetical protein